LDNIKIMPSLFNEIEEYIDKIEREITIQEIKELL